MNAKDQGYLYRKRGDGRIRYRGHSDHVSPLSPLFYDEYEIVHEDGRTIYAHPVVYEFEKFENEFNRGERVKGSHVDETRTVLFKRYSMKSDMLKKLEATP